MMKRPLESSHILSARQLLMAMLCMPLTYGVVYFLRLCKEAQVNPDKYLDSPASFGVGCIYAGIFSLPALIGIMVVLIKKGNAVKSK